MKKVITCLDCEQMFFLRSLLFVRNQLHTKNTYTHTPYHNFFLSFFEHFSHFVCLSLFFSSFFLSHSPFFALTVLACIHTHTYASQTQCTCMLHYIRWYISTNPQYHRSHDRALTAVVAAAAAAATVCWCNPQIVVWCIAICEFKWISGHWKPMNLFVRSLVYTFFYLISISCLLLSFQIATTATTNNTRLHSKGSFCTEAHCNPL